MCYAAHEIKWSGHGKEIEEARQASRVDQGEPRGATETQQGTDAGCNDLKANAPDGRCGATEGANIGIWFGTSAVVWCGVGV
jgi:hypothetical protein